LLGEWQFGHLAEAVLLVLSELVTNSVNATSETRWEAGLPPVRLWVLGGPGASGDGEVMLLVWDAVADLPPGPRLAGPLEESGRGLWLAKKYSRRLDFYRPSWEHGGKVGRSVIDRSAPLEDQAAVFRPGHTPPDGD
jgi:hypothetical protein